MEDGRGRAQMQSAECRMRRERRGEKSEVQGPSIFEFRISNAELGFVRQSQTARRFTIFDFRPRIRHGASLRGLSGLRGRGGAIMPGGHHAELRISSVECRIGKCLVKREGEKYGTFGKLFCVERQGLKGDLKSVSSGWIQILGTI